MDKPEVVILCGGKGSRLSEETISKPKPLIEIGGKPILWHIMQIYSRYGHNRFILALGYRGEDIKKYFYDYLGSSNWEVNLVDTGLDTLKGGRVKRLEKHITSDNFHLTYGDGVANINIDKLHDFHISHGRIGTVTTVRPPSRFGELILSGSKVVKFEEKAQLETGTINGGFFVFKREFMKYLTPDIDCDLEFGALQKLAQDGELQAYNHAGFWQCMDNVRDRDYLNKLWNSNQAKWEVRQ